jgi:hypothetical protein
MKYLPLVIVPISLLISNFAFSCPEEYEVCLRPDEAEKVRKAVEELDEIKNSELTVDFQDPIIIIRDWDGRVYVNGGDKKPLKATAKIGNIIDRELSLTLPTKIYEREEPEESQFKFRTRFRANFGILLPEIINSVKDEKVQDFWSFGLDMDFLKLDVFNVSIHAGSAGVGGGTGIDITKNFGANINLIMKWLDQSPSLSSGVYFSF